MRAVDHAARRRLGGWEEPDALAVSTWRNSGQLSHGDHDESEITPEDFLWETLPGRCCFSGRWDPKQRGADGGPKWVSVSDCSQCQVWGQADASCHNGVEQCKMCGMDLYCPGTPPPLIGGAKVCAGSSRVGEGCNDVLKMGGTRPAIQTHKQRGSAGHVLTRRALLMRRVHVDACTLLTCCVHAHPLALPLPQCA
jgi:hypothetical protein